MKAVFIMGWQHHRADAGSGQGVEKLDLLVVRSYPTTSRCSPSASSTYLLPACTSFEWMALSASNRSLQWGEQIVKPVFRSKNDYDTMYMLARKLGYADQMFKNIKVENARSRRRTSCARSIAAAGRPTTHGQSPERLKAHMANQSKFDVVTLRAARTIPKLAATITAAVAMLGTPEFTSRTPVLYNANLTVKEGGGTFRALKRRARQVSLLSDGPTRRRRRSRTHPEFTLGVLKKLGWDRSYCAGNGDHPSEFRQPDAVSLSISFRRRSSASPSTTAASRTATARRARSPGTCRIHSVHPRIDLHAAVRSRRQVSRDPTPSSSACPRIGFSAEGGDRQRMRNSSRSFSAPAGWSSSGGGETRSSKWLAELKQDMYVGSIGRCSRARHQDGAWVWSPGPNTIRKRG
jgi:formate dehydrogenase major subunit